MDSIFRAYYSVDTSVNSSVTMPSPLPISSNSKGGNQSVKRKMVFDAKKNRKTNSKCEVVVDNNDDDDDFDDDVVVHLATISNKEKVREAVRR